jgi:hypothetical protein
VEAGYFARLTGAFTASVTALVDVAEGLSILGLASLPWLAVLGVFIAILRRLLGRMRRRTA